MTPFTGPSRPARKTAWWARQDSNLRPIGYEPTALTPELRARVQSLQYALKLARIHAPGAAQSSSSPCLTARAHLCAAPWVPGFPGTTGFSANPLLGQPTSSLVLPPALSSHRGHPVPTEGWSRRCTLTSGRFVVAGTPAHLCAPPWVPGFPGTTGFSRQPPPRPTPPRPTPSSLVLPPAHSSHRGHPVPTEGWSRRCALTLGRFVVAGTPPGPWLHHGYRVSQARRVEGGNERPIRDYIAASAPVGILSP